jgi:hypothetical protein
MAVTAGDSLLVHPALQKRSVDVNLILNLPIGVVERFLQQCRTVGVHQRASVLIVFVQDASA